ncbi:ABC transporter ATP-binding protein [Ornithinibacillus salinisoli]|uniref:ABC transporter ATP-binding protein n=1 Tax=Ornithinibacillus salinisoli TaxID=1848459 RepID=A0ABW4W2U4_9BACI
MAFLEIDQVTFGYKRETPIITDVSWKINKGEFHSLLGRSGCGKTTLLKLASGLLNPVEGAVYLQKKKVVKPSTAVGFVFQSPTLLEWKNVIDNVLLPITLQKKPNKEEINRAEYLLDLVGLSSYRSCYPEELSGGQQSRVAIARALIKYPTLLFMDEPFAALDAITREELQDDLLRLCQMEKTSVLFVTHDISEAIYLSDQVALMEAGKIIYNLPVDLPKHRTAEMRYQHSFNELCLNVRQKMSGQEI